MRLRWRMSAICGLLALSSAAWADADGSFCVGPDYLAVEFSFSKEPRRHRLYVWHFADALSWKEASAIDLPEFNNGPMACTAGRVSLAGWDALYDVSWTDRTSLSLRVTPKQPGATVDGEFPDNRGSVVFGPAQTVPLPSADVQHSYVLAVERTRDPQNRCTLHVRSRILQYRSGTLANEHELFSGTLPAECGE